MSATKANPATVELWDTTLSRGYNAVVSSPGSNISQIAARLNMDQSSAQNVMNDLLRKIRVRAEAKGDEALYYPYSPEQQKRDFDAFKVKVTEAEDIVQRESIYQAGGRLYEIKVKLADLIKRSGSIKLKQASGILSQSEQFILNLALGMRPAVNVIPLDQFGKEYRLQHVQDQGYKPRPTEYQYQQAKKLLEDIEYGRIIAPWEQ